MKTSENLCAKMNIAECLESFIKDNDHDIDYLTACLEDENIQHDSEVDESTKESIRIHKKSIEIAYQFLRELE